jgi:hypothetical protein
VVRCILWRMTRNRLRALGGIGALVAVVLVAFPVLGVDPSPSGSAGASASASVSASASASGPTTAAPSTPESTGAESPPAAPSPAASAARPNAAPSASSEAIEPEEDEDAEGDHDKGDKAAHAPEHPVTLTGIVGRPPGEEGEFTLVVGIKVYHLEAGPKWWWGDANPLAAVVGKSVTIDGEQSEGSDEVDVLAIDGKAIREPGRPPWAGGWKVVGPKHPGWAQWKVDKQAGKTHGRDGAPGQLKKDAASPTP